MSVLAAVDIRITSLAGCHMDSLEVQRKMMTNGCVMAMWTSHECGQGRAHVRGAGGTPLRHAGVEKGSDGGSMLFQRVPGIVR